MANTATETVANPVMRRRWYLRWRFIVVTLVAVAGLVGVKYVRERMSSLPELRIEKVERRDLRITVGTTGTIEPKEIVQVNAEVIGKIVKFGDDPKNPDRPISVGSEVSEGAILLQLDDELYRVALQRARAARRLAEADLARLQIQLRQAERDLELAQRLRATNSQSEFDKIVTEYDTARTALSIGEAKLEQAVTSERQAEINLEKTAIRAPIDGVVIDHRANVGQNVNQSAGLFLLAKDLNRMRIRASVSESDIGKIEAGQAVTFTVDAYPDVKLTGQVEEILLNARVHGTFVTYDVLIAIDNTDVPLFPNMTADVEFEIVKRENAWLVPNAALKWKPSAEQKAPAPPTIASPDQSDNESAVVWVPMRNGWVRPVAVGVGIDDGVMTEVTGPNLRKEMSVVVGTVKKTTLARIVPSARTTR